MQSTMMSTPLLISSMLDRANQLFPHVEIVSMRQDGSQQHGLRQNGPQQHGSRHASTYRTLHGRVQQLGAALQAAGIRKGDRVATLMCNEVEHLEAYFGIPASGAIVHTLNLRLHPDDLACIVDHAGDRFLIVDANLLSVYEQIRANVHFERVFVVGHGAESLPPGCESYESFLASAKQDLLHIDAAEDDAAAMCYTSGTTGKPKGVVYSHRAIALHTFAISLPDQLSVSCHDTVLPVVSMFHVNAWGFPYAATMNGSKLVLPGRNLQPEAILDMLQAEQVTLACAVPTIWMAVLNTLDLHPGRWKLPGHLRLGTGGMAAPESLFRRFAQIGVRVIHSWGMTETTPVAVTCNLKPHMQHWPEDHQFATLSRQGMPLPFIQMRSVSDDSFVPHDGTSVGELQVKGPWIASSYYGKQQENDHQDKWTADGWFRTGDVVTIDEEGYVKITDRMKDLIKSGGEWISSVDLESALVAHPAIKEAAVIAVPHPRWQERPVAIIVLKDASNDQEEVLCAELRAFLEAKFARWQVPDAFVFVQELPHTSTGKLLKTELRARYQDWQWTP